MEKVLYEKCINDMYKGWYSENDWNKKVYKKWYDMILRVYSDKFHENNSSYINCTLCLE